MYCPSYFFSASSAPWSPTSSWNPAGSFPTEAVIEVRWPTPLRNAPSPEVFEEKGVPSATPFSPPTTCSTTSAGRTLPSSHSSTKTFLPPPLFFQHELWWDSIDEEVPRGEERGSGGGRGRHDTGGKKVKEGAREKSAGAREKVRSRGKDGDNDSGRDASLEAHRWEETSSSHRVPRSSSFCAYHPSGGWICRAVAYEESEMLLPFPVPPTYPSARVEVATKTTSSFSCGRENEPAMPPTVTSCAPREGRETEKDIQEGKEEPSFSPLPFSSSFPAFSPTLRPLSSTSSFEVGSSPSLTTGTPHYPHLPSPSSFARAAATPSTALHPLSSYLSVRREFLHSCPLLKELMRNPNSSRHRNSGDGEPPLHDHHTYIYMYIYIYV